MSTSCARDRANAGARRSLPSLGIIFLLAIFLAILCVGIFVPLYGDEAATKLMRGMFVANGWKLNTLVPQCQVDYLRSVPRPLLPGALAYDFAFANASPLGIRITGMIIDACAVSLMGLALHLSAGPRQSRWAWFAATICFIGLGVLPLTLVMARGEQVLLLLVMLFVCVPGIVQRRVRVAHRGRVYAYAIAFLICESILLYTHPKALFFFPVLIVSAWLAFWPLNRIACACVLGFTLLSLRGALHFAFALTECPNAPIFSGFMQSVTTPPGLLLSHPLEFVAQSWANVWNAPDAMLVHMRFAATYQSGWLAASPGVLDLRLTQFVNAGIELFVKAVFWLAIALPPIAFAYSVARRRRVSAAAWIVLALWGSLAAHVAMYRIWNFYAAGLILPLMAIVVTLSFTELAALGMLNASPRLLTMSLSPLYLLFVTSAGLLLFKVMPPTIHASLSPGIGMPGQLFSVPTFNYASRRTEIRAFASRCNMQGDGTRRLVIDNLTFFAFDGLREPLQSDYVTDKGFGVDYRGDAVIALLRQAGAKGIIAQCTLLSDSLLRLAINQNGLCCVDLDDAQ